MDDTLTYIKNKFSIDTSEPFITLPIDRYRGFCGLLAELGFKKGVEVGTLRGMYAKWLCAKIRRLKLYCVDPYVSYNEYSEDRTQEQLDEYYKQARQRLAKFNVEFVKKFSMDAVKDFEDNSLDFVYIDANHSFQYVVNDIAEWSKKVRVGGIVSGHDYSDFHYEVRAAVDGWLKAGRISPCFLTNYKNWFYVKQGDNIFHRQFREKE